MSGEAWFPSEWLTAMGSSCSNCAAKSRSAFLHASIRGGSVDEETPLCSIMKMSSSVTSVHSVWKEKENENKNSDNSTLFLKCLATF